MPNNTILIVDDDPDILGFYRKIFDKGAAADFDILGGEAESTYAHLKCLTFSDPRELIRHCEETRKTGERHPLCIIDMRMPILNGMSTALRIREIDPDIDIIICTAFSDVPVEEIRAKLHGGVFFVRKPFVAAEFSLLVHSLVGYWNTRHELVRRTAFLMSLLESIPDLVFMKDIRGVYLDCNAAFCRLVGRTKEQIIGHTDHDLFAKDAADGFRSEDRTMLESGEPRSNEEKITYPDGLEYYVETLKSPIRSEEGKCLGIIGVSRDITGRKDREEELRRAKIEADRANAVKSAFLAVMSHEIRTPLNGIIGIADILDNSKLDGEQRAHLKLLVQSGQSLLALVNDILDFSKIESGQIELEQRPFDLADEIQATAALFRRPAEDKGLEFKVELGDMPPGVIGDSHRLRQIIWNILSNAVKFTPSGKIVLKAAVTSHDADSCRLDVSVSDSGIGIPDAAISQLFEPFQQVDTSTTRKFGGTGLGLSITKRLVQAMSGEISVKSGAGGTTFFLHLMLKPSGPLQVPQSKPPEETRSPAAAERLEILLVEDNSVNQLVALSLLKRLGHRASVANSGREAVDMIAAGNFDLVFMDLQMPEMGGLEAAGAVRKLPLRKQPRIIALTANAFEEDRERCLAGGMDGFISKPFQFENLAREIAAAEGNRPVALS